MLDELISKAYAQLEAGSYQEAISIFKNIINQVKDRKLALTFNLELGRLYYLMGNVFEAKSILKKAYTEAIKNRMDEFAQEIAHILLEVVEDELA